MAQFDNSPAIHGWEFGRFPEQQALQGLPVTMEQESPAYGKALKGLEGSREDHVPSRERLGYDRGKVERTTSIQQRTLE